MASEPAFVDRLRALVDLDRDALDLHRVGQNRKRFRLAPFPA